MDDSEKRMQSIKTPPKNFTSHHLTVGAYGETLAVEYLEKIGYRIIATNFTAPIGYGTSGRAVTGEIDIISYDERQVPFTLAFVEVKTRTSAEFARPESAVDRQKQRHIIKAARIFRRLLRLEGVACRYDVISIVLLDQQQPQIHLLPGYFTEQIFTKSHWLHRSF